VLTDKEQFHVHLQMFRTFNSSVVALVAFGILVTLMNCSDNNAVRDLSQVPNPKDTGGGYVSDPDSILSQSVSKNINDQLTRLDESGQVQVALVLLNSIGEQVPKDFAVELFNYWRIGAKEKDNGLLILLIKDQHRVEFETGYGIEDVLPDITCFQIQQDYMVPYFKAGDFDTGIQEGINALAAHFGAATFNDSTSEVVQVLSNQTDLSDNYETEWENNIYTVKHSREMSLLKAWTLLQKQNEFLNLPIIPDTSRSFIERTPEGFIYTFEIPYAFSFENSLDLFWNCFVFLFFNAILTIVLLYISFGGERRKYNKNEPRRSLFSNLIFSARWFPLVFLLLVPIGLLQVYLFVFKSINPPVYVFFAASYCSWLLYVHLHYLILIPAMAKKTTDRHSKHESLSEGYRNLRKLTFIFPFPFLWLSYMRHRIQMRRLRELPYTCECGTQMKKLNEVQDNEFIAEGEIREEELNSIDYDVWVCGNCNRHRTFQFENFQSSAIRCKACSKKTVKLDSREVVKEATTSSQGYGYNHFRCRNCNEETKIRFIISKKSSSGSGSSGSSSSGSSSSSSWGGGSSGGGGAGSSW
jgi:uncharacterized protein